MEIDKDTLHNNFQISKATELKEKGNEAYSRGNLNEAIITYSMALNELFADDDLRIKIYLNRAAAYLHSKKFNKCIKDCNVALEKNSMTLKAYYRKARALYGLKQFRAAILVAESGLKVDPECAGLQALLDHVKEQAENPANLTHAQRFHKACRENDIDYIEYLFDCNFKNRLRNPNCLDIITGLGGLHVAAVNGSVTLGNILLEEGLDVNLLSDDEELNTPLHIAVISKQEEMVTLLLEFGADASLTNAAGKTPIDLAADNPVIAELLKTVKNKLVYF